MWARENGCPWDEDTCENAAEFGLLEVLKWARANGCPWDEDTCTYAALNGHLGARERLPVGRADARNCGFEGIRRILSRRRERRGAHLERECHHARRTRRDETRRTM